MTAFFLIDILIPQSNTQLDDYAGMGRKYVWISASVTVIMVALAGLPPTLGFTSKLLIFSSLWDSYQQQQFTWMLWLLIGGILNAAISLAYYLRLPYLLFFKNISSEEKSNDIVGSIWANVITGFLMLAVLALFFKPEWLMQWISAF